MIVHTALMIKQSSELKRLVRDFIKETQIKTVIWDDVYKATFKLFVQFAYIRDYTLPVFSMKVSWISSASDLTDFVDRVHVKKKSLISIDSLLRDSDKFLWGFESRRKKKEKKEMHQFEEESSELMQVTVKESKTVQVPEFD